eukprot:NODE_654_length_4980_cov_0.656833.p3 type:complete len:164 gc:universal NODE_654_length_4980_cov_0.656833:518-27(-)
MSLLSSNSSLSSNCQAANLAASHCIKKFWGQTPSEICGKCRNFTEVLFTKCNAKDFNDYYLRSSAIGCHQEDGEYCRNEPKSDGESKIDPIGCPNKCSQFVAKFVMFWEDLDSENGPQIRDCAAKYPYDPEFGSLTTYAAPNSISSAATTTFTVLTLSTLILF